MAVKTKLTIEQKIAKLNAKVEKLNISKQIKELRDKQKKMK